MFICDMEIFATACKATPIFMQTDPPKKKLMFSMVINGMSHVVHEMFQRFCCISVHEASAQGYSLRQFRFRNLLLHNKAKFLQGLQMGYSLQPINHFTCCIETPI